MYEYRARLVRVVGPLTVSCDIDLGFHTSLETALRLDGLAQPAREDRAAALALTEEWLAGHEEGFLVQTVKPGSEKWGRGSLKVGYLARIVGGPGDVLNDHLLKSGLVEAMATSEIAGEE